MSADRVRRCDPASDPILWTSGEIWYFLAMSRNVGRFMSPIVGVGYSDQIGRCKEIRQYDPGLSLLFLVRKEECITHQDGVFGFRRVDHVEEG